jgi:hypothetical protein
MLLVLFVLISTIIFSRIQLIQQDRRDVRIGVNREIIVRHSRTYTDQLKQAVGYVLYSAKGFSCAGVRISLPIKDTKERRMRIRRKDARSRNLKTRMGRHGSKHPRSSVWSLHQANLWHFMSRNTEAVLSTYSTTG